MKFKPILILILLIGLITAACQKTPQGDKTGAVEAPVAEESYPAPEQPVVVENPAYPDLSNAPQASLPYMLYPDLKDGDMLEWENVPGLLFSGLVSSVSQTHDLQVTIRLKDGRSFITTEPAIDNILKIIQECGDLCKDIKIATE